METQVNMGLADNIYITQKCVCVYIYVPRDMYRNDIIHNNFNHR